MLKRHLDLALNIAHRGITFDGNPEDCKGTTSSRNRSLKRREPHAFRVLPYQRARIDEHS